jgi:hypothetical protein
MPDPTLHLSTPARALLAALSMVALLALGGCGPVEVRSAPPGSDLDGVAIDGDQLVLRLLLINRNDIPLTVDGVELDITLGAEERIQRNWPLALVLGPRNREAIELRLAVPPAVLAELNALERGERGPLEYALDGYWSLEGTRDGRIERSGYLHPVPGRPGRFR